jgi:hypothetical protein
MSAIPDPKSGRGNFVPKLVPAGIATPAEFKFAEELRRAFKQGDDWAALEPPVPTPPTLPPASATVVIEAEAIDESEPELKAERSLADDLNDKVPF